MKRYVSIDFLRGLAIIGVIAFHILTSVYNYESGLEGDINIAFLLLVIFLWYLGNFFSLFIAISSIGNVISIDKQIAKALSKENKEDDRFYNKIIVGQLIRGSFVMFVGYFSEVYLNGLLLNILLSEETPGYDAGKAFFRAQILVIIGLATIISSTIYILMRKKGKNKKQIAKFFLIGSAIIVILTPVMIWFSNVLGFPEKPGDFWDTRNFGINLLYAIITNFVRPDFPLFPNLAASFIGIAIGINISENKIEKNTLDKTLLIAIICFIGGIISYLIFDTDYFLAEFLMPLGGSLIAIVLFLYLVEVRGKGKKFAEKTTPIRRFGFVTLTLWALQWLVVLILLPIQAIVNLVENTNIPVGESRFLTKGLLVWETWVFIISMILMYHIILVLWERVNFKGTFEWLTVKLMVKNRPDAAERLKLSKSLYDVEPMIAAENAQEYYGRGAKIGMILMFLLFTILFDLLTLGIF